MMAKTTERMTRALSTAMGSVFTAATESKMDQSSATMQTLKTGTDATTTAWIQVNRSGPTKNMFLILTDVLTSSPPKQESSIQPHE